jgi:hypothetical protein
MCGSQLLLAARLAVGAPRDVDVRLAHHQQQQRRKE